MGKNKGGHKYSRLFIGGYYFFRYFVSAFAAVYFQPRSPILFSYAGGYIIAAFLFLFFLFPPAIK